MPKKTNKKTRKATRRRKSPDREVVEVEKVVYVPSDPHRQGSTGGDFAGPGYVDHGNRWDQDGLPALD